MTAAVRHLLLLAAVSFPMLQADALQLQAISDTSAL
jgi:hypothetical protein